MCSKNRINHHTNHHTWTPGFLGGNPSREKTTAAVAQPSIFYYRENILQHMCWRRLDQHAGTHLRSFTSLSWKGATTPWLVYQPLLEGSYDPPISFTSLTWKGATTPWLKATTFSTTLDHVSSIFTLDPTTSIEQHLQARFIIFSNWTLSILLSTNIHHQQILINKDQIAETQQNRSDISYPLLQQTLVCIRAFLFLMSRIYALPSTQTSVYICIHFTAHTLFFFSEAAYILASSAAN